jgi:hypothetical protein
MSDSYLGEGIFKKKPIKNQSYCVDEQMKIQDRCELIIVSEMIFYVYRKSNSGPLTQESSAQPIELKG